MSETNENHTSVVSTGAMSTGWACIVSVGGVLMGIANLIPGVSGGTMILAIGIYEEFIASVAELSSFRFSWRRIVFVALVFGFAGLSIVLLSGVILSLLLWRAPVMFALFIGLTLGGAPLLLKMIGQPNVRSIAGAVFGLGLMIGIVVFKDYAAMPRNPVMDVVSGVVGSTTMVLPGISGSYMLLILDQYDRVIGAVADLKERNFKAFRIIGPVGIGAVVGIVGLSNLLKYLLNRHKAVTLGVLLGMLLGSVMGLWPFDREPKEKALGRCNDAELIEYANRAGISGITDEMGHAKKCEHILAHWSERKLSDFTTTNIVLANFALLVGFICTLFLGRLDKGKERVEGAVA